MLQLELARQQNTTRTLKHPLMETAKFELNRLVEANQRGLACSHASVWDAELHCGQGWCKGGPGSYI